MVENLEGVDQYIWQISETERSVTVDDLIEDLLNSVVNDNYVIFH